MTLASNLCLALAPRAVVWLRTHAPDAQVFPEVDLKVNDEGGRGGEGEGEVLEYPRRCQWPNLRPYSEPSQTPTVNIAVGLERSICR